MRYHDLLKGVLSLNGIGIGESITILLIISGTILSVLSAFGIVRLPDVYTRIHAATKSASLGVLCILIGVFIHFWFVHGEISVRLLLGILFIFLTAPAAGHMICRSAYRSKVALTESSVQDDLKAAYEKKADKK